jgi:hypothetical protein
MKEFVVINSNFDTIGSWLNVSDPRSVITIMAAILALSVGSAALADEVPTSCSDPAAADFLMKSLNRDGTRAHYKSVANLKSPQAPPTAKVPGTVAGSLRCEADVTLIDDSTQHLVVIAYVSDKGRDGFTLDAN